MPRDEARFKPFTEQAPAPAAAWTTIEKGEAVIYLRGGAPAPQTAIESDVIARSVFASTAQSVQGVDYAIEYHLADGYAGGDVVDVYEFDNGSIAFTAVDVEGRGTDAATLATLCKFGLRAYASAGMIPEFVMQHMDQLYMENCAFAKIDSFASIFFGYIDAQRNMMGYCSAGHDVAFLARPGERPVLLPVTAPIVGVFEDQKHLFHQRYIELLPGTILVIGTDGITEARSPSGEFFGYDGLSAIIDEQRNQTVDTLAKSIMDAVMDFSSGRAQDDIAVLVARFTEHQ